MALIGQSYVVMRQTAMAEDLSGRQLGRSGQLVPYC